MIIINADDFGRSMADTDAAIALAKTGRVTSVSAMVFMKDSERAAALATELEIDAGLHLNFSERWTGGGVSESLALQHQSLVAFFKKGRYAQLVYNPRLRKSFENVYQAQVDEFQRLYGRAPSHVDGHHHLHLCANMLIGGVIPQGIGVRRNFTFGPDEKGPLNRAYRRLVDTGLGFRYVLTDYFFALEHCLSGRGKPPRLVADLAKAATVEIMTHPRNPEEFGYLVGPLSRDAFATVTKGTYAQLAARQLERPVMLVLLTSLFEWTLLYL